MKDKKKTSIGILAYNEEAFIQKVINDLLYLNIDIYIIDDCSTDNTRLRLKEFENNKNINIIFNEKNLGAGLSTKKLIEKAAGDSKDFLIKVDGDGQFSSEDVEKILDTYLNGDYEFIKSNRFWSNGIIGRIPKIRFFGNLFATLLLQFSIGSNLLFDPLNGLFGVSTSILNILDNKNYPKRYGYPFFIAASAIQSNLKTKQLNNTVKYSEEESNLSSIKVFATLLKLSFYFYIKKYKSKKYEGLLQKSAFFDFIFMTFLTLTMFTTIYLISTTFFEIKGFIKTTNLFLLIMFFLIISLYSFSSSFRDESNYRKNVIDQ